MFERFGAAVVSAALYGGFVGPTTTEPLKSLDSKPQCREAAEEWLTGQYDRAGKRGRSPSKLRSPYLWAWS
jgi:hypothetical protein